MDTEIKPGDVVVLKSDSAHNLKMTVVSIANDTAVCWGVDPNTHQIINNDHLRNGIPLVILKKIP